MTHAEKRLMMDTARKVDALGLRVDAMCALVERLMERKAGRPSRAEAEELEQLRGQIHGQTH